MSRTRALFLALAILYIAPVWSVRYFPTGDGPSHVYNSWILHGLVTGDAPPQIERAYRVDWRPIPNWTSHAVMAALISVVSPIVAEKLFLTLTLGLLFAGAWVLARTVDPLSDVYAFLVFPFAYIFTFVAGYYNFTLGIALYLFILAWWWRRGSALVLALLLVLSYFTHPIATLAACGAIVLLSALLRRFRHLLALPPALLLLAFFGRTGEKVAGMPLDLSLRNPLRFVRAEMIASFHGWQRTLGLAVAILFALLLAYTLIRDRKRPAIAFVFVALGLVAVMVWIPAPHIVRSQFVERLPVFVFLTLIPAFSPRIEGAKRNALLAVLALIALVDGAIIFQRIRVHGAEITRFVRSFDAIEPGARVLTLQLGPVMSHSYVNVFVHRFAYVALERQLVHLMNYESASKLFPTANRDETAWKIANDPDGDLAALPAYADYVVMLAGVPQGPKLAQLQRDYVLAGEKDDIRIYRSVPPRDEELILLPLLGTPREQGAPGGTRWRIDQTIHNRGPRAIDVRFRRCLEDVPCTFTLAPGETRALASLATGSAMLGVPRGEADHIEVSTVALRADVERPDLSVATPAARESAFIAGGTRIENIGTRDRQISLRVYTLSARPSNDLTIRVRPHGEQRVLAERTVTVARDGMWQTADLYSIFGDAHRAAPAIDIDVVSAKDVRCWAFSTARDAEGRTTVHVPGTLAAR